MELPKMQLRLGRRLGVLGLFSGIVIACTTGSEDATDSQDDLLSAEVVDATGIGYDDPDAPLELAGPRKTELLPPSPMPLPPNDADISDNTDDENQTHAAASTEAAGGTAADGTLGFAPDGKKPMSDHGGTVMDRQNVYLIYYGDWAVGARQLLHTFVDGLGHNNFNRDFFGGLHYKDKHGHAAFSKGVTFGGAYGVGKPYGNGLNDDKIAKVVHSLIAANKAPIDPNGLYLVLTAADVKVAGQESFCGWHSSETMSFKKPPPPPPKPAPVVDAGAKHDASAPDAGPLVGVQDGGEPPIEGDEDEDGGAAEAGTDAGATHAAPAAAAAPSVEFVDIKYGVILNPSKINCSQFGTPKFHSRTPNNNFVVDSMVSVISHEIVEAVTDPDPWEGWFDTDADEDFEEIADKCAWYFTSVKNVNHAQANLFDRHARRWWLIQSEFESNHACTMGNPR